MIRRLLLSLLVLIAPFASPAAAQTSYNLTPAQDTDIRQNGGGTNFCGSCTTLSNRRHSTGEHHVLYQFDLSSVPASSNLVSATLRIWVTTAVNSPVGVYRITEPWSEAALTWANSGGIAHDPTASGTFTPASSGRYYDIDVTNLVALWRGGTSNYGVLLKFGPTNNIQAAYTSREWGTASERPQLVVVATALPVFTAVASSVVQSDPYNAAVNPKMIPGATILRSVVISNTSGGRPDSGSVVVVEPIPARASLYVRDYGGAGSGPVSFTQGSPSSALTYSYASLASSTDDLSFSNNNGVSFGYTPVPDSSGYDAAVTHVRVNPKGTFAGAAGSGSPSFTLRYRVTVK